jgi:hypothetical protein
VKSVIPPDPAVPIVGFDAERDVDADPEFDVLLQPEGILQIEQAVQRRNDVAFGRVSRPSLPPIGVPAAVRPRTSRIFSRGRMAVTTGATCVSDWRVSAAGLKYM